jgi:hypothetical protein
MSCRPLPIVSAVTLAVVATLLVPPTACADVDTWKEALSGYFHDGSRWADGTAPGLYDTYQVLWGASTGNRTIQSMTLTDDDVTFRIPDSPSSPYTWTITDRGNADATVTGGDADARGGGRHRRPDPVPGLLRDRLGHPEGRDRQRPRRSLRDADASVRPQPDRFCLRDPRGGDNAKRVSSSRFALGGCGVREEL